MIAKLKSILSRKTRPELPTTEAIAIARAERDMADSGIDSARPASMHIASGPASGALR